MNNNWQQFWDQRFSDHAEVYGPDPNIFFREFLDRFEQPGSLLLPAEGEGRNAVYAAARGWEVDAFDFSTAARERALQNAAVRGVSFSFDLLDVRDYQPVKQYDLVALLYAHLPPAIREPFHRKIVQSLKPGGFLLLEAFTPEQLQYKSGGPQDISMLYTAKELTKDFDGLRVLLSEEKIIHLNQGPFHQGEGAIVRWIGQLL